MDRHWPRFYGRDRETKRKAIKRQQRKRPLFSHLDRENSVDKGFFFFYDRDEEFCLEDPTR